jgi:hypothetical protein
MLECLASCFHRQINVSHVAFCYAGDHFFGGRVNRFESFAAGRRYPLAADKALRLSDLRPAIARNSMKGLRLIGDGMP